MKRMVYILLAVIGVSLFVISRYNYLLFHTIIEFFAVLVAMLIFTVSVISRSFKQDSLLNNLGPGIMVVSFITFLHLVTYKGIYIIPGYDANLPTQLWIILNYIQATAFLVALLHQSQRPIHFHIYLAAYLFIGGAAAALSFLRIFPVSYDNGLTTFKIVSEYVIIMLYLASLIILWRGKSEHNPKIKASIMLALSLFIAAEFTFTLYQDVYGILNFFGHYIRLIAFSILYVSLVVEGIKKPHDFIFKQLNDLSITDELTQLFNHRHFFNVLDNDIQSYNGKKSLFLVVCDIDKFKTINDRYGHMTGDKVLLETAVILKSFMGSTDSAFRYGGDEFALIFRDKQIKDVLSILERLKAKLLQAELTENCNQSNTQRRLSQV